MLSPASERMVPTTEQSYFQVALRNLNASLNIPTMAKLKKKKTKELLGLSGSGKEKLPNRDTRPLLTTQDLKTIFSQVRRMPGHQSLFFWAPVTNATLVAHCIVQTEVIYNFNNHFLQTIQERLARWHYEQTIGDIFLSVVRALFCHHARTAYRSPTQQ
jgi:hypothetical protein